MSVPSTAPSGGSLGAKLASVPHWTWLVGGAALVGGWFLFKRKGPQSASAPATDTSSTLPANMQGNPNVSPIIIPANTPANTGNPLDFWSSVGMPTWEQSGNGTGPAQVPADIPAPPAQTTATASSIAPAIVPQATPAPPTPTFTWLATPSPTWAGKGTNYIKVGPTAADIYALAKFATRAEGRTYTPQDIVRLNPSLYQSGWAPAGSSVYAGEWVHGPATVP